MKILIAADMEGITGVTRWDHVDSDNSEYARFRRIMTAEVNAAIRGAYDGGASEVIVADGHSAGTNILVEELDERAHLNSGTVAPFSMIQGIGPDIQGVIFIGYHARAGTAHAILDHTWSGRVMGVWLNDRLVSETGLNAAVCGHFEAPVLMVTGDQAVCAEATVLLGAVETVEVKRATGRFSAQSLPVKLAQELIQEAAQRAVKRLKSGAAPAPFKVSAPVHCAVEFSASNMADGAALVPGVTRQEGRLIAFEAADMPAAYQIFRAVTALSE
jgi:D-amino peptidase